MNSTCPFYGLSNTINDTIVLKRVRFVIQIYSCTLAIAARAIKNK